MACATQGCGRQTVSSRAKFCRPCYLEKVSANGVKSPGFRVKHALVVKKRWLDKILDGEKNEKSALRAQRIEGACSVPRAKLLASCSAALG